MSYATINANSLNYSASVIVWIRINCIRIMTLSIHHYCCVSIMPPEVMAYAVIIWQVGLSVKIIDGYFIIVVIDVKYRILLIPLRPVGI